MVHVITVASGKGGTGKTTVTINLGTVLASYGKKTFIMDADIGMANIGLMIGLENVPVTLHEVLAGTAGINEAIYDGPGGVKVIPSGISLQGFQQANPERLKDVLKDLVDRCDFLLIDAPAGISRDGVIPLSVADGVILVVNPELSSIVDALKTKILTEVVGGKVIGVIVNRIVAEHAEHLAEKMEKALGVGVIGVIPEDPLVKKAAAFKVPVVTKFPLSDSSKAIKRIAAKIAGKTVEETEVAEKDKFIDKFAKALFRGRK
ncbi:MAG: cell division ATPase MinD [Methanomicrobiales archaeon]|jgi:septum site-determining protein MinD|nr:cell division ATPase MinD [Methanomicrobiales archaeon]